MNTVRIALLLVLYVTWSAHADAQIERMHDLTTHWSNMRDLVNLTKIYVHSSDYSARRNIVKELNKAKHLRLQVCSRVEDAEFALLYGQNLAGGASMFDYLPGAEASSSVYGEMVALRLIKNHKSRAGHNPRTKVCWFTRQRQVRLNTGQLLRSSLQGNSFNGSSARWNNLLTGLSLIPLFQSTPISRGPEIKATRAFIRDLSEARRKVLAEKMRSSGHVFRPRELTSKLQPREPLSRRRHKTTVSLKRRVDRVTKQARVIE